jgi:hypothetical protein
MSATHAETLTAPKRAIVARPMTSPLYARARFHLQRLIGSPPPQVVFLHIPKCAGTTINRHFKSNFGGARSGHTVMLDSYVGNAREAGVLDQARSAQYVAGHFGWSAMSGLGERAFTFTVLRDPFERLQALYRFARKPRRIRHPAFARLASAAARMDFTAFCLHDACDVRAYVDNAITRTLAHDYYPYRSTSLADVRLATAHLRTFDLVLQTATLSSCLNELARATGTLRVGGGDRLNRTDDAPLMPREAFITDPRLYARIAYDQEVWESTLGPLPGLDDVDVCAPSVSAQAP